MAESPPLWPALWAQATQMQFFRFCELLERSAPNRPLIGTTDSPRNDPVWFRSRRRLGFPGREIDGVEFESEGHADDRPSVRTAFLGLYGVDARMPSYFIDEIVQCREGAEPLAAFLDLFHHRIVTQYYRSWRKYRYPIGFESDGGDPTTSYLLSLAGLGLGASNLIESIGPRKLLSMLGLVSHKTRTAEGLAGVLRHAVPGAGITVEEFYPVWVAVGHLQAMQLGDCGVLGGGFWDRSNCVRVVLVPASREVVAGLLPGEAMHGTVMKLLRFYLGYEAQAIIDMQVPPELMPLPVLRPTAVCLGYTAMLAPSKSTPPSVSIRVQLGSWNISGREAKGGGAYA